ncbi:MAG: GNAT family N-acetyltransferase [Pseudomonadota bacterium]
MIEIRPFRPADASAVNALGLAAFEQYRDAYDDWPAFQARIANTAGLAEAGELIVAERDGRLAGAVAYFGPGAPKPDFFRPEWPIMRMLVVAPQARGHGIGRALAQACLERARRDGAPVFALHTSAMMQVALPMYLRMGFAWHAATPLIHGVRYDIYLKHVGVTSDIRTRAQPATG